MGLTVGMYCSAMSTGSMSSFEMLTPLSEKRFLVRHRCKIHMASFASVSVEHLDRFRSSSLRMVLIFTDRCGYCRLSVYHDVRPSWLSIESEFEIAVLHD